MNYDATMDLTREWSSEEEILTHLNLVEDGSVYITELADRESGEAQTAIVYVLSRGSAFYGGPMDIRIHQSLSECVRDLAGLVGV